MLVDTHCHLTEPPLVDALDAVMARARVHDVGAVIAPAYDVASWAKLATMASTPGIYVAYGIHPWVAHLGCDIAALRAQLCLPGVVAVGEIGLDFKISPCDRAVQLDVLRKQLALAVELRLPVLLHCRGAFEELLLELARFQPRGLIHAFSRGPEMATRFCAAGLHVAVGGAVTRPQARALKAAAQLPLDRLLFETDAPSIGLDGIEPSHCEPMHVATIAGFVAHVRNLPLAAVAAQTTANAELLFGVTFSAPVS